MLGPFISDPVGGMHCSYVPTTVGNYTFTAYVEPHTITGGDPNGFAPGWGPSSSGYANVNDTYVGATSLPVTLVVQSAAIAAWPNAPLPTNYWTNPINAQNRDWWTISGNWLDYGGWNPNGEGYYYKGGGYNPYTVGPATPI